MGLLGTPPPPIWKERCWQVLRERNCRAGKTTALEFRSVGLHADVNVCVFCKGVHRDGIGSSRFWRLFRVWVGLDLLCTRSTVSRSGRTWKGARRNATAFDEGDPVLHSCVYFMKIMSSALHENCNYLCLLHDEVLCRGIQIATWYCTAERFQSFQRKGRPRAVSYCYQAFRVLADKSVTVWNQSVTVCRYLVVDLQ